MMNTISSINYENNRFGDRFLNIKNNKPLIWSYTETLGIKVEVSGQLDKSHRELKVFNIIFDNVRSNIFERMVEELHGRATFVTNYGTRLKS